MMKKHDEMMRSTLKTRMKTMMMTRMIQLKQTEDEEAEQEGSVGDDEVGGDAGVDDEAG